MSSREADKEAIRKRGGASKSPAKGGVQVGKGAENLRFFTEDAPGLKVHPKTVLIISLVYIGVVVLLHIWSKLGAGPTKTETTG